jgi:Flp pilus assembly protein TadG
MPAALLVLLVLAAIAVDSATAFLGQRELANATEAAANDAAAAIDEQTLRATDRVTLDAGAADTLARQAVAAHAGRFLTVDRVDVVVAGRDVEVTASGSVAYVFSPAVGGARRATFHASSTAELEVRP